MRVLVAMSGGVDSSVAAALLAEDGHDVLGATMKLWGGASDTGCCSVSDVEDARRVAQQLDIRHHVFNFGAEFTRHVVDPYAAAWSEGRTPNPCVECNRHVKFDRFLRRAAQLGFDAVATGHHARVTEEGSGRYALRRGVDPAKDQSYVLAMLTQRELANVRFPIGEMTKGEVRAKAAALGLRTAAKPDSQDVCFITSDGGRAAFLGERIPLSSGRVVDRASGEEVGRVDAVQLVTIGQRRGLGGGAAGRRYATAVDVAAGVVTVGPEEDLLTDEVRVSGQTWVDAPLVSGTEVLVQVSAHGQASAAVYQGEGVLRLLDRQRMVAPGQTVALYDGDRVVGSGIAL